MLAPRLIRRLRRRRGDDLRALEAQLNGSLSMSRRQAPTRRTVRKLAEPNEFSVARDLLSQAAPHVVTHWLGDPDYRDPQRPELPRRLRLRGDGPCLRKLIERVVHGGDVRRVVAFLVQSGAVRQVGSWFELESRFIPFRSDAATALFHTVKSVRHYVDTISHNMSCGEPDATWVERSATNHSVPAHAAPVIHRYLRRRVGELVDRLDAYLRRWEIEPLSEPTVEISLHAFAHQSNVENVGVVHKRTDREKVASRRRRKA